MGLSDQAFEFLVVMSALAFFSYPFLLQAFDRGVETYGWLIDMTNATLVWVQGSILPLVPVALHYLLAGFGVLLVLSIPIIALSLWEGKKRQEHYAKLKQEGKMLPDEQYFQKLRGWRQRWEADFKKHDEAMEAHKKKLKDKENERLAAEQNKKDDQARADKEWDEWKARRQKKMNHEYVKESEALPNEINSLMLCEYKRVKISPFGDTGAAYYWVKTSGNERPEHAFFRYLIRDMVSEHAKNVITNKSDGPDVEFRYNNRSFAFDVETGTNYVRHPEYLGGRYSAYRKKYTSVFILVLNKKLRRKYAEYGIVVTRGKLKGVINSLFSCPA